MRGNSRVPHRGLNQPSLELMALVDPIAPIPKGLLGLLICMSALHCIKGAANSSGFQRVMTSISCWQGSYIIITLALRNQKKPGLISVSHAAAVEYPCQHGPLPSSWDCSASWSLCPMLSTQSSRHPDTRLGIPKLNPLSLSSMGTRESANSPC